MKIAVATDPAGNVGHSWGKARTVAVADVVDGRIQRWDESEVGWDVSHDAGTHGSHHATVARFLREHAVAVVLVTKVGDGMARMLNTMGLRVVTGVTGDARVAVQQAAVARQ
ncbi:MAG: NifB/NifX family molybdenum-iron cluster-binding protein [Candidatus Nanopelagicales bacterium]